GGVVLQARMRRGAPAAALVEQQNLVALRVEQASMCAGASPAGTAMQEDRRLAIRVAAKLPVHTVTITGVQVAMGVGMDLRIHYALRRKIRSHTPWPSRRPRVSNLV